MSITLGNGSDTYWGEDFFELIKGENGDDYLYEYGSLNLLSGGNGQDAIASYGMTNLMYGDHGDDFMIAGEYGPVFGHGMFGGNGDDYLVAIGTLNGLHGDVGNDVLVAIGSRNGADGGKGDDILVSMSTGNSYAVGMGNALQGEAGEDRFFLQNLSDLRVLNGDGDAAVIDENDSIVGVLDVIGDYEMGEVIEFGGFQAVSPPVDISGGHPVLGDGEYTFVRGKLVKPGHFDVFADGSDLLLMYDTANGTDEMHQQGAVVLIGVTDPAAVTIGELIG